MTMGKQTQKNPMDVANKWSQNLGASTQRIQSGVQAVTVSPTALAARQQDAYLSGVQQAVANGRWQAGLNRVSLSDWQTAMIGKGLPRIQQGATVAKPKVEQFMTQWLPFVYSQQKALASQPRGSLEQNIARMNTFVRSLATFKRS
jgi:hypothetical protein